MISPETAQKALGYYQEVAKMVGAPQSETEVSGELRLGGQELHDREDFLLSLTLLETYAEGSFRTTWEHGRVEAAMGEVFAFILEHAEVHIEPI